MEKILIRTIEKDRKSYKVNFDISDGLEKYFAKEHCFRAEYTFDIGEIPESILVIPLLTNILQLSWLTDSVVWVKEVDADFYAAIPVLKDAFRELHPSIEMKGTLIAAKIVKHKIDYQRESLQLFTGGIDATSTLLRIEDKNPILFNTNGWYKENLDTENAVYNADFAAINSIAQNFGLAACFAKSNFGTFINGEVVNKDYGKKTNSTWWFGFQHSPAFLGLALVAAYYYRVKQVYIASSYTFGQYVVCVSDPRIDSCFTCAGITTVHDGYELSRQDKVRMIVEDHRQHHRSHMLRVCSFNTGNCCYCEKCFRSMLALAAEGAEDLKNYGFEFETPFAERLQQFLLEQAMELDSAHIVFWEDIIQRMNENSEHVYYKDVYELLRKTNLRQARKNAILNHYRKDYREIIPRKLKEILHF